MLVEFQPEGEPVQSWNFDAGRLLGSAAERIEEVYGDNFDRWSVDLRSGRFKARKVLLWHLQTLAHPGLQYRDMPDFRVDELLVSYTSAELTKIREVTASGKVPYTEQERTEKLAFIDMQIAEVLAKEAESGGTAGEGKAPFETSSIDGGSTS